MQADTSSTLEDIKSPTSSPLPIRKMQADTSSTLGDIKSRTSSSIVSTLLDLQKYGMLKELSLDWIQNLEVINPSGSNRSCKRRWDGGMVTNNPRKKFLWRTHVNAQNKKDYIALSYTWEPPSNEPSSYDAYQVQSRNRSFKGSEVRDQVFDRVIAYLNHCKAKKPSVKGFWIDRECIDQANKAEKQLAIQSMEYVYIQSAFPVALLSARIESEDYLRDLIYILKRDNPPRNQERYRVRSVLSLLDHITSDLWWDKGWTFQEDYCASTKMRLLIPHSSSLTELKDENRGLLGDLEGELCITSADFRSQATKFCMDYKRNRQFETMFNKILERAGKYNVQLQERDNEGNPTIRQSMSPTIFSNVGKRNITVESDRLAVIANCLGYPIRLDTNKMDEKKYSLSIAMLALFLLNGEILMNNDSQDALGDNIFDYLRSQSVRTFQPPDIDQKLTFIKHCRFPFVELSKEGIKTSGHLWRLGKIVKDARETTPPHMGVDCNLSGYERMRLCQLAEHLDSGDCGPCYQHIADAIDKYLDDDEKCEKWKRGTTFSKYYKDLMAKEIVKAMDDRRFHRLRLGSLIPPKNHRRSDPYSGLFTSEAGHSWTEETTYVFTAVCPAEDSTDSIEKHVSLEVELLGSSKKGRKQLVIKRWINGLFFFDRSSPITEVVFPWPKSLLDN